MEDTNLIPDVTTLPGVPENLKTAIRKFPEKLLAWKDKLRTIHPMYGIWTMLDLRHHFACNGEAEDYFILHNDEIEDKELAAMLDKDNPGGICSNDSRTLGELLGDGVIMMFVGYACHEQFIENKSWPDSVGENSSKLLVAEFRVGNTAVVRTKDKFDQHGKDHGSLFWPESELEFEGTWEETFVHLVKLYTKVGKSFSMDDAEIPDPSQG